MSLLRVVSYLSLVLLVLAPQFASGAEKGMNNEKPTIHKSEKYGLNFFYVGDKSVKEFLATTPCVSGVWWKFHREDEDHYIGELHYPTENTANYQGEGEKRSPQYYMVFGIKVRKQEGLPIDLKTFRGALVLRDPNPTTPLSIEGDESSYELVGYQDMQRKKEGKYGFLFSQNEELKYVPPKN